jgi:hypothetical protein
MDKGFSVVIENRASGVTERYTPCGNGMYAITYHGDGRCMYCGKYEATVGSHGCRCDESMKIITPVAAYRQICSVAHFESPEVNEHSKKLILRKAV